MLSSPAPAAYGGSLFVAFFLSMGWLAQGCGAAPDHCATVPRAFEPELHDAPCPLGTPKAAVCGTLTLAEAVPSPNTQRGALAEDAFCRLEVAWLSHSQGSPAEPVPLFVIGGGPGDPLLSQIHEIIDVVERAAPGRTVVVHDPRGVGSSTPRLDCRDVPVIEGMNQTEWLAACAAEYRERGHDARAYRTSILADDIATLGTLMGFETFDVLGVSYGSRVAQVLAKAHPERVRALILDAATPTDAPLLERLAGHHKAALRRLFDDCEASKACKEDFPQISIRFQETLERLRFEEESLELAGREVPLIPALYISSLSTLLSESRLLPAALAYIQEVYERDYESVEYFLENRTAPDTALFMHHAVMCAEELPRNDRAQALADLDVFPEFSSVLPYDSLLERCQAMELLGQEVSASEEPIAVPTLALTGRYDPLSPLSNWSKFADRFSRGTLVDLPTGHGALRNACGQASIAAFLANPTRFAPPACVSAQRRPDFTETSLEVLVKLPSSVWNQASQRAASAHGRGLRVPNDANAP